jgi:hypothetical protein
VRRSRSAVRLGLGSELEASADVHHRRTSCVDRADDLLDIDPLQVDARGGHVRMSQLPLDDGQRHSLARELDRVRVTELMLVPTSAQAPLRRPLDYAESGWRCTSKSRCGLTDRSA